MQQRITAIADYFASASCGTHRYDLVDYLARLLWQKDRITNPDAPVFLDRGTESHYRNMAARQWAEYCNLAFVSPDPEKFDPQIYENGTFGMLRGFQDRLGVSGWDTWHDYAVPVFTHEMRGRMRIARNTQLQPLRLEDLKKHQYSEALMEVAEHLERIHAVRHVPDSPGADTLRQRGRPVGTAEDPAVKGHLEQDVIGMGFGAYVTLGNLTRGNTDHLGDPLIVYRDRIGHQDMMGARNKDTWHESKIVLAHAINNNFGTSEARNSWEGAIRSAA